MSFDMARLKEWIERVAKCYSEGVTLVKITMEGQKVLRSIQIQDDVSLVQ